MQKSKSVNVIIRYYVIFDDYYPLLSNEIVDAITIIQRLPVSPIQLYNALGFFSLIKMDRARIFSEILFVLQKDIHMIESIFNPGRVNVIISSKKYLSAVQGFSGDKTAIFISDLKDAQAPNVFDDHKDLLSWIRKQGLNYSEQQYDANQIVEVLTVFTNAAPLHNLHWIKNQILGYIWYDRVNEKKVIPQDRAKIMLDETNKIFWFHLKSAMHDQSVKFLPPLLIALPSIDFALLESLRKFEVPKEVLTLVGFGQDKNYTLTFDQKMRKFDRDSIIPGATLLKSLSKAVDAVSYLHAQLTFSPIWRMPLLSNQFDSVLGRFSPPSRSSLAKGKKLIDQMEKLGAEVSGKIFTKEQIEYLAKNESQLVFLTDFPVEWVECDGMPLCFSHDVCRVPLNNFNGAISHFVKNQTLHFEITNDIMKDVLLVMASPNDPVLKHIYEAQIEVLKENGFENSVFVSTKKEFFKIVNSRKPKILIVDSHGGYDAGKSCSFLCIGEEVIEPDDIAAEPQLAPIVFLSACSTYPLRNIHHQITEALFSSGCLSVTSSYVPIDARLSSALIVRLIVNLMYASKNPVHQNWLSFLAHLFRTSFFSSRLLSRGLRYASAIKRKKYGSKSYEAYRQLDKDGVDRYKEELANSMVFEKRKGIYAKWRVGLDAEIAPEYLFYTNLGRPDLISFKVTVDYTKKKSVKAR